MSNDTEKTAAKIASKVILGGDPPARTPERTPIKVAKLLFVTANPNGLRVPFSGRNSASGDHMAPTLNAGAQGPDVRIDIEFRPWMRHHRVVRHEKQGNEWKQREEFYVHEHLAVWVPAEE